MAGATELHVACTTHCVPTNVERIRKGNPRFFFLAALDQSARRCLTAELDITVSYGHVEAVHGERATESALRVCYELGSVLITIEYRSFVRPEVVTVCVPEFYRGGMRKQCGFGQRTNEKFGIPRTRNSGQMYNRTL